MSGFGKIYEQTFTGSMMGAGATVFAVWSYAIAHLKPPGRVELNPRLIAALIGAPVAEVAAAIELLASPDAESRTKTEDGRRLVREGEFLYRAPNFEHYRSGLEDERKKANAERQKKWREKHGKKNGKKKPDLGNGKGGSCPIRKDMESDDLLPKNHDLHEDDFAQRALNRAAMSADDTSATA